MSSAVMSTLPGDAVLVAGPHVSIVSASTGAILSNFQCHSDVYSSRWNHNYHAVASAGAMGKVYLSNNEGQELLSLSNESKSEINALAFTGGSRYLATGGSDAIVSVWDLKKQECIRKLQGHTSEITCLSFATDAFIVSGSSSGNVLIHGLQQGSLAGKIALVDKSIRCLSVCGSIATKPLIAVGSDSGSLHLLDLNSRTQLKHVAGAHRSPVAGIATSKSASAVLASCGADQVIRLWDGNDLRPVNSVVTSVPLSCIDFFADGYSLAAGSLTGELLLYDIRKLGAAPMHQCTVFTQQRAVRSVHCHQGVSHKETNEFVAKPNINSTTSLDTSTMLSPAIESRTTSFTPAASQDPPSATSAYTQALAHASSISSALTAALPPASVNESTAALLSPIGSMSVTNSTTPYRGAVPPSPANLSFNLSPGPVSSGATDAPATTSYLNLASSFPSIQPVKRTLLSPVLEHNDVSDLSSRVAAIAALNAAGSSTEDILHASTVNTATVSKSAAPAELPAVSARPSVFGSAVVNPSSVVAPAVASTASTIPENAPTSTSQTSTTVLAPSMSSIELNALLDSVRSVVKQELSGYHEHQMLKSLRAMQLDVMTQLHHHQNDISTVLDTYLQKMMALQEENRQLREELARQKTLY